MPYTCIDRQTIWINCPRPAPLATNNPYREGRDGTKWDVLPKMLYTCVHRYTIWINCPGQHHQPPITPTGGGVTGHGARRKGGHLGWDAICVHSQTIWTNWPIVPGQHHWPPITPTGGVCDGTWDKDKRGTSWLRCHIHVYIARQYGPIDQLSQASTIGHQ